MPLVGGSRRRRSRAGSKGNSQWISFVKSYARDNDISYGESLKEAGPEYHAVYGRGGSKSRVSSTRRRVSFSNRPRSHSKRAGARRAPVRHHSKSRRSHGSASGMGAIGMAGSKYVKLTRLGKKSPIKALMAIRKAMGGSKSSKPHKKKKTSVLIRRRSRY